MPYSRLLSFFLLAFCIGSVNAEPTSDQQKAPALHLGVVTCAGSTCHGSNAPLKDSNVEQNEFILWHRKDKHAKAFTVLFNENSKRIAKNLGIKAAHTDKSCLGCHTDNVPAELQGNRFQQDDGVGCEACHGGSEHYLGAHVSGKSSHAENIKLGLYPTEEPVARAKLCLQCHLGDKDKFATHRIMGAGHPRISFELDTFTHIQPMHFKADKDYQERKGSWNGLQVWAVGQLLAVERYLDLLQEPKYQASGIMPELAFFDCHACHRPMKSPHWAYRESSGLQPGTIHLNDANMLMLRSLLRHIAPNQGEQFHKAILQLHQAASGSLPAAQKVAASLRGLLADIRQTVLQKQFSIEDMRIIAIGLAKEGKQGNYNDYGAAEQVCMALGAITEALQTAGGLPTEKIQRMDSALKELDSLLKDENAYDPERMIKALATIESILS